jgi:hypothetical protein
MRENDGDDDHAIMVVYDFFLVSADSENGK